MMSFSQPINRGLNELGGPNPIGSMLSDAVGVFKGMDTLSLSAELGKMFNKCTPFSVLGSIGFGREINSPMNIGAQPVLQGLDKGQGLVSSGKGR